MTDTSVPEEAKSKPNSPVDTVLWDFCINVGLRGAHDLRRSLGLDEVNFRHIAPIAHDEPSRCYVYRLLDEVQKAALSIMQWKEYLSDGFELGDGAGEEERQFGRLAIESVIDDQQFRARKLSEILVDSILFSTTNDQPHFRDYFYLYELNESARSQQDRMEFFGFQNRNTGWHAEWLLAGIQRLEKNGLDPQTRWYLAKPSAAEKGWATRGVPFSSFRQRYKQVVSVALASELTILGKSYMQAYGMSKDVHFTPHDISSSFSADDVLVGANKVALLLLALVIRCQHLMGCVPEGVNREYRDMHDSNAGPTELLNGLKAGSARIGDVVWVHGKLAEVIEATTSKYGYPAYHVKYIEEPPLPEISDDWFAGFEVKLVTTKAVIEQAADSAAQEVQKEASDRKAHTPPDRDQLLAYAKQGVVRIHHHLQQRRAAVRSQTARGQENAAHPEDISQ